MALLVYPAHLRIPGFGQTPPQGWIDPGLVQAQMTTPMRQQVVMDGNPFWSPEARSFLGRAREGNGDPHRALDPSQAETEARQGLGNAVRDGLNRVMTGVVSGRGSFGMVSYPSPEWKSSVPGS